MKMEKATRKIIKELVGYRFDLSTTELEKYENEINLIPEYEIAYSDISQICNESKTIEECLSKIIQLNM